MPAMTGLQHFEHAAEYADRGINGDYGDDHEFRMRLLAYAQVHAQLAAAVAMRDVLAALPTRSDGPDGAIPTLPSDPDETEKARGFRDGYATVAGVVPGARDYVLAAERQRVHDHDRARPYLEGRLGGVRAWLAERQRTADHTPTPTGA